MFNIVRSSVTESEVSSVGRVLVDIISLLLVGCARGCRVPGRRGAEYHHAQRDRLAWPGAAAETEPHALFAASGDRTVVRGIARQLAAQPSDAANLLALVQGQWALDLEVSTEAEAHGRKHLFGEGMLLPRAETGVER
jgi:hypothetical protein